MSIGDLALRARGVQFSYFDRATRDTLLAIERIDLEIPEGQFVSIVGASLRPRDPIKARVSGRELMTPSFVVFVSAIGP